MSVPRIRAREIPSINYLNSQLHPSSLSFIPSSHHPIIPSTVSTQFTQPPNLKIEISTSLLSLCRITSSTTPVLHPPQSSLPIIWSHLSSRREAAVSSFYLAVLRLTCERLHQLPESSSGSRPTGSDSLLLWILKTKVNTTINFNSPLLCKMQWNNDADLLVCFSFPLYASVNTSSPSLFLSLCLKHLPFSH